MSLQGTIEQLVIANRILAQKGVLDSFGHVSARHPENSERYLMSRARSARVVEKEDILEYTLDSKAIDSRGFRLFGERPIHGCIYRARPDVMAVCHNHAYGLLPFAITNTVMRPAIHMASAIGEEVHTWDIRDEFGETNLLVTTNEMGDSLAGFLANRSAALMRGHGSVVVGRSIPEMVFIAYYLQINAEVLIHAEKLGKIEYLSPQEVKLSAELNLSPLAQERVWEDWVMQAGFASPSSR
ncbi:MAG TPA: class II aldolase/adducin family protein [Candidatus Acidoferrales bacterium]|nr:class II aldolase/adducin family protein [Candidatus Acidoferrales bacterium]